MNLTLSFLEEKNGYNRSQVNAYINKLLREYEHMNGECKALEEKYRQLEQSLTQLTHEKRAVSGLASHFRVKISQLERENARLNARPPEQIPEYVDKVAHVLMDAELLASQIVDRANQEAERLLLEARTESDRIAAAGESLLTEIKNNWEILRAGTP